MRRNGRNSHFVNVTVGYCNGGDTGHPVHGACYETQEGRGRREKGRAVAGGARGARGKNVGTPLSKCFVHHVTVENGFYFSYQFMDSVRNFQDITQCAQRGLSTHAVTLSNVHHLRPVCLISDRISHKVERVAGGCNDFGKSELLLMVMDDPVHNHAFGSGT